MHGSKIKRPKEKTSYGTRMVFAFWQRNLSNRFGRGHRKAALPLGHKFHYTTKRADAGGDEELARGDRVLGV